MSPAEQKRIERLLAFMRAQREELDQQIAQLEPLVDEASEAHREEVRRQQIAQQWKNRINPKAPFA